MGFPESHCHVTSKTAPSDAGMNDGVSVWVFALGIFYFLLQTLPTFFLDYGLFIDELYYLACAARPQAGYVDHPPLAPLALGAVTAVFGESLIAVRTLPALLGTLLIIGTGFCVSLWRGGRFAQLLAALGVCLSPLTLIMGSFFSMNIFEIVIWPAMVVTVVEMIRRDEPRLWLVFGVLAGLGLETKHTIVLLAGAVVATLLLTSSRRFLFSPWLVAGGVVAALLFAPNLWWQVQNDWISLDFYRGQSIKNLPTPPQGVLLNQLLVFNPAAAPIWIVGLVSVFSTERFRPARFLGIVYLLLLASMIWLQLSRPGRIAGLYPVLFAIGAIRWEEWTRGRAVPRAVLIAAPLVVGAVLLPVSVPLLPPVQAGGYASSLGLVPQIERGEGKRSELPQWLADRLGWERYVQDVVEAYEALDEEERGRATVLAPSYGHAGALEHARRKGILLPPVMSSHNTYFLWGRELVVRLERGPVIAAGTSRAKLAAMYDDVREVGRHHCEMCLPWRRDFTFYVGRTPRRSPAELRDLWEGARNLQ